MVKRAIGWFISILISFIVGLYIDYSLYSLGFPWYIRIIGLVGMIISFRLLQLSGKYLKKFGDPEEWGLTTKLVTTGLYSCVRHPHHLGIGLMITSMALLIGGLITFIISSVVIWILILWFLKTIEEPELLEKFGDEYVRYKDEVPMLFPRIICLLKELVKGI